ncbi:MAG: hypothetical protein DDT28_00587 [Dehalococcoidia bacterium]|nr:hypothetical protein [Chloroflexota bacterium]
MDNPGALLQRNEVAADEGVGFGQLFSIMADPQSLRRHIRPKQGFIFEADNLISSYPVDYLILTLEDVRNLCLRQDEPFLAKCHHCILSIRSHCQSGIPRQCPRGGRPGQKIHRPPPRIGDSR